MKVKSDHGDKWKSGKCGVIEAKIRDFYEEEVVIC